MIFNSIGSFYQKEKLSIKNKKNNPRLNKRERIQCNRLPYQPSKRSNKNNTIQWANTRGIDFCNNKTKVQLKNYLSHPTKPPHPPSQKNSLFPEFPLKFQIKQKKTDPLPCLTIHRKWMAGHSPIHFLTIMSILYCKCCSIMYILMGLN